MSIVRISARKIAEAQVSF